MQNLKGSAMGSPQKIMISVIIPVYGGEDYVDQLAENIREVKDLWETEDSSVRISEAIFVDDNAIDNSPDILDRLRKKYDWVTVLHMSRNFGQHPATVAGILHSSGDWVVTLDEDLQHPPEKIIDLLREAAKANVDVVYAQPLAQVHNNVFRDLSSRLYKLGLEIITRNKLVRMFNSFRLIRGAIARAAASICNHDTYFDVAISWFTNRYSSVPLMLSDRRFIETGRSGYSLKSLLTHARRLLFTSQLDILRLGAIFGMIVSVLSVIAIGCLLVFQLIWPSVIDVRGWTSTILAITFFGGVTLLMLGIALEYISTLIQRAHGKPLFFIIDRSPDQILKEYFSSESK